MTQLTTDRDDLFLTIVTALGAGDITSISNLDATGLAGPNLVRYLDNHLFDLEDAGIASWRFDPRSGDWMGWHLVEGELVEWRRKVDLLEVRLNGEHILTVSWEPRNRRTSWLGEKAPNLDDETSRALLGYL